MYESFYEEVRTYFLEDIIISPNDIVCASIVNINKNIYYDSFSDICIDSIPKNKDINAGFFFKYPEYYREKKIYDPSEYNFKIDPINNQIYVNIKVKLKTTNNIILEVKIEDFIETTILEDITAEQNLIMKELYVQVKSVPFIIKIRNPEFIRTNDAVYYKYKLYEPELPNLFSIKSNRLYLNITNSSLILPQEIPNGSLCIAMLSSGNILRSKTINDIYKNSQGLPFLVDVNTSEISIPDKFLIMDNGRLAVVPNSTTKVVPQSISADYSIISIHLRKNDLKIDFEELANKRYYNQIFNELFNVTLKTDKNIYLGFAIVNNTGSRIIQENIFLTNNTINISDREGSLTKSVFSSCNKSLVIDYLGNSPPIIQLKDSVTNEYIIPNKITYKNNKIYIDVYENKSVCYDVIVL